MTDRLYDLLEQEAELPRLAKQSMILV